MKSGFENYVDKWNTWLIERTTQFQNVQEKWYTAAKTQPLGRGIGSAGQFSMPAQIIAKIDSLYTLNLAQEFQKSEKMELSNPLKIANKKSFTAAKQNRTNFQQ